MSFDRHLHEVARIEATFAAQRRRTSSDWRQFKHSWRKAWTPGRIVVAGLLGGYLLGHGESRGTANLTTMLRLLASLSAFRASHQATEASGDAEQAATNGENPTDTDADADAMDSAAVDPEHCVP